MKREIITVTRSDIKAANRKYPNCRNCPVTLAVQRTHPEWAAGRENLFVYLTLRKVATLPKSAQTFIRKFDSGKKVEPFRFAILLPANEK